MNFYHLKPTTVMKKIYCTKELTKYKQTSISMLPNFTQKKKILI